jgi:thiol-disulfide isomerase/thioredoxin
MAKNNLKIVISFLLLVTLVQLNNCSVGDKNSETQANTGQRVDSKPTVPAFVARDLEGNWHNSSEWIGQKPVVINFWGTWCPPCRREIPDFVKLYDEYYMKGVEIISLAVNDTPDRVKDYAYENNMDWVLLLAQDQILIDFKITNGVPMTVFIDKDGVEVGRYIGMKDYNSLKRGFDAITNQES